MSETPAAPIAGQDRRGRRRTVLVIAALATMIALGVVYAAAPSNDWYLPGQTVELRTAVEYKVNGSTVWTGVVDVAHATINGPASDAAVTVSIGDTVRLRWPFTVTVISIDAPPPGDDAVGGTGAVTVRVGLG